MRFEHHAARAVHGDAVELCVEGGDEAADFDFGIAAQKVEGPGAVFAAAPGEEGAFHPAMIAVLGAGETVRGRGRFCNSSLYVYICVTCDNHALALQ